MALATNSKAETQLRVAGVIVAAGSGTRLGASAAGGSVTKALRLLDGKPLVTRSAEQLIAGGVTEIVVVCAAEFQDVFAAELRHLNVPVTLAVGGPSRQDSVRNGLAALTSDAEIVLVHDAARPLVPARVVRDVITAVVEGAVAVVPVIDVTDSIREITAEGSRVVDRSMLRAVQTPQGFQREVLVTSHAAQAGQSLTDDASVCAAAGHLVSLVAGDRRAMKITDPLDFAIAEALLRQGVDDD